MRTRSLTIILLLVTSLLFSACDEDTPSPLTPTSLEISFKDHLGNPVYGATVKLYSSEQDWQNDTYQVGSTKYSDAEGKVTFTNLSNIKYYWKADKDCYNNMNGGMTTTVPLTANQTNTVGTILSGTGSIKLVSTSTNPYRIYINGKQVFDMQGGETRYAHYIPTGTFTVRVLQLSGYVLYPTDQTYTETMACGEEWLVKFP